MNVVRGCARETEPEPKSPNMDKPVLAEIFSQGDEVVTGQITDTNAAWLAERLQLLGFDVSRHTTVGDRLERLVELLGEIAGRADCCICTGGLGPTVDDLTAEAVALAFGRPLELDSEALAQIKRYFAQRGYPMPEINCKQAMLPRGAQRLDNRCGTAPGFALRHDRCRFAFLPGVPTEMKEMFTRLVVPGLTRRFPLRPARLFTLRTVGIGESSLQQRLQSLPLPDGVRLGFRAGVPENEVKLLFPAHFPAEEAMRWVDGASQLLGDAVFSIEGAGMPGGHLAAVVGRLLQSHDARLAVAESTSAGQITWQCRGQSWLLQSVIAPEPRRLWVLLDGETNDFPGDPFDLARWLAGRLRETSGAEYALVNIGELPAPESLTVDAPSSALTLAVAGPGGLVSRQLTVAGSAERRHHQSAAWSLDLLRRTLLAQSEASHGHGFRAVADCRQSSADGGTVGG